MGIIVAIVGILITRLENAIHLQPNLRHAVYLLGVLIGLAGIVVYASGMGREKVNSE